MSIRMILRIVAVFCTLVGLLIGRLAGDDPAPRDGWQTYRGTFASATFVDSKKLGRIATITLDGSDDEAAFMLTHAQDIPDFERRVTSLPVGAVIEIDAIPREKAGWAAPEGQPLYLLVMRQGSEVIYDRDRDATSGNWLPKVVRGFGFLFAAAFFIVFLLTFRKARA